MTIDLSSFDIEYVTRLPHSTFELNTLTQFIIQFIIIFTDNSSNIVEDRSFLFIINEILLI